MNNIETLTTTAKVDNVVNKEEILSIQLTGTLVTVSLAVIGFRYINAITKE